MGLGARFLIAGFDSTTVPDQFVVLAIGLFLIITPLWLLVFVWMQSIGFICVVCNDEGVRIRRFLRQVSANWQEIQEFGTYKVSPKGIRVYYLKARKFGDKRIVVCGNRLGDLDQLIDMIFQRAVNAKCLREENVAMIPFTKKLRIEQWKRN
jgi:hypothetical protein